MFASRLARSSRRSARTVVAAVAALVLVACTAGGGGDLGPSDPPAPPSDNIYGTWFLESVSGELLPGRINQFRDEQLEIDVKEEIVSGFVVLNPNQTFEFAFITRATAGSTVGPDILVPPDGALQGGKFRREGNLLRRVRSTGETGEALVLTGDGKLQWVLSFPQGAPGSTVDVPQTLTYSQSLPAE